VTSCGALFVGAQVMFEIRQSELRRGISLKC
jgi:protein-cysteine N-palmitoyltransferase HHAT